MLMSMSIDNALSYS